LLIKLSWFGLRPLTFQKKVLIIGFRIIGIHCIPHRYPQIEIPFVHICRQAFPLFMFNINKTYHRVHPHNHFQ
jgi:hypothetical protein